MGAMLHSTHPTSIWISRPLINFLSNDCYEETFASPQKRYKFNQKYKIIVYWCMSIDKAYIKTLPRESLLMLISLCVEVLQEEEAGEWLPTDAQKNRIDAIVERHDRGEGKSYSKEEFRKNLDNLMAS